MNVRPKYEFEKLRYLIGKYKSEHSNTLFLALFGQFSHLLFAELGKYKVAGCHEDLIQAGKLGLGNALDRIDLTYANEHSVYLYVQKYIRGEIVREIKNHIGAKSV